MALFQRTIHKSILLEQRQGHTEHEGIDLIKVWMLVSHVHQLLQANLLARVDAHSL